MSIYLKPDWDAAQIPLGIYLHFPYCNKRCPYCDFTLTTKKFDHFKYLQATLNELHIRHQHWIQHYQTKPTLHSLYLGGGTPGLWDVDALQLLLQWIKLHFLDVEMAEITIEANPAEMTVSQAQSWRLMGINRLSLGTQSFQDQYLKQLGRTHTAEQAEQAVQWARYAGFRNINLDLIHGMFDQSIEDARQDVLHTLSLEPEHVALYQLSIEERTSFGVRAKRGEVLLAPEQRLIEMYQMLDEELLKADTPLYEVSNAARQDQSSRHNMLYWTLGQYWGIGVGAHGLIHHPTDGDHVKKTAGRWQNTTDINKYLTWSEHINTNDVFTLDTKRRSLDMLSPIWEENDQLSDESLLEESILVGLRLTQGIAIHTILYERYAVAFQKQIAQGYIEEVHGYWRATLKGRMLLDHVIWKILLDDSIQ